LSGANMQHRSLFLKKLLILLRFLIVDAGSLRSPVIVDSSRQ
jgi:hypothetical protein